ncbi:hypothetical protein CLF_113298, partial [Clonorchis sinensis]
ISQQQAAVDEFELKSDAEYSRTPSPFDSSFRVSKRHLRSIFRATCGPLDGHYNFQVVATSHVLTPTYTQTHLHIGKPSILKTHKTRARAGSRTSIALHKSTDNMEHHFLIAYVRHIVPFAERIHVIEIQIAEIWSGDVMHLVLTKRVLRFHLKTRAGHQLRGQNKSTKSNKLSSDPNSYTTHVCSLAIQLHR